MELLNDVDHADRAAAQRGRGARIVTALGTRPIVLVGLMGCGKSSVGRRLAQRLRLPFVDADAEIETAAGMSVPDIFAIHGEDYFRDGERRVIARLLAGGPKVLATGGGAYMNAETRQKIAEVGVSIWLKAEIATLLKRVRKRSNRPLLQTGDPEATLRRLMDLRHPVYAEADITVISREAPHDVSVDAVMVALETHLAI